MGKDSKEPPAKKSRGRPVGSLNKPKAPGFNYSNDFNSLAEPQSLSQSIANATINKANAIKKEALIAAQQRDKQLGSSVSSSSFSSSSSSSTTTSQQHHLDNHQQLDADEISPLALQLEKKDDIKDKESSTKQPTPTLPQPPSSILKKPTLNSFKNNLNNNNSTLILPGGGGDQQLVLPGGQTDRSNTTTTNIISSSTTITNDANNASKQAAEEAAEEENDLEDDLGDLQGNLPITKNSEAMRLLLESMTEEQQDRYEVYRRAGFNKNEMKKVGRRRRKRRWVKIDLNSLLFSTY